MGEAIKKVEDLSIRSMQNKVKEWYEKFNDWRGWIKYSDELRFWCQQVIDQIDSKVNTWFSQLNGPKSKLSKDYRTKRDIFAKKSKNIRESIKRCCDSWTNVKRVHKDRLNNLAWKIDNYENAVVKMVNDLIDQQNEMQWVLKKRASNMKKLFWCKRWHLYFDKRY
jgi:gas vesicle protein